MPCRSAKQYAIWTDLVPYLVTQHFLVWIVLAVQHQMRVPHGADDEQASLNGQQVSLKPPTHTRGVVIW